MAQLFIAREGFVCHRRGEKVYVHAGDVAEAGSWPLGHAAERFQPLEVRFVAPKGQSAQNQPNPQPPAVSREQGGEKPADTHAADPPSDGK